MIRNILHDQCGSAITIMLLLLIPLFLAGIILTTEHPRILQGGDIDLGQAVSEAVRAAAMCVDDASQANGTPQIDPDRAHLTFRHFLAKNLGLSGTTLEPLPGSEMKTAPSYVLLVYNGDDTYMPTAREYSFLDGSYSQADLSLTGFPHDFAVGKDSIIPGTGKITTTLRSPGCIAVVRDKTTPVLTGNAEPVRWAAARIVTK